MLDAEVEGFLAFAHHDECFRLRRRDEFVDESGRFGGRPFPAGRNVDGRRHFLGTSALPSKILIVKAVVVQLDYAFKLGDQRAVERWFSVWVTCPPPARGAP